jgi:hypothetical protein
MVARHGSLMDYAVPKADDLVNFELDRTETPSPVNALGVKGIGEAGTIVSAPRSSTPWSTLWHRWCETSRHAAQTRAGMAGDPTSPGEEVKAVTTMFEYHAPTTLQEALSLLTQHGGGEDSAGGHSLFPS